MPWKALTNLFGIHANWNTTTLLKKKHSKTRNNYIRCKLKIATTFQYRIWRHYTTIWRYPCDRLGTTGLKRPSINDNGFREGRGQTILWRQYVRHFHIRRNERAFGLESSFSNDLSSRGPASSSSPPVWPIRGNLLGILRPPSYILGLRKNLYHLWKHFIILPSSMLYYTGRGLVISNI